MSMPPCLIYAASSPTPTLPTKAFLKTGSCSVAHAGLEFANHTNEDLEVIVSLLLLPYTLRLQGYASCQAFSSSPGLGLNL